MNFIILKSKRQKNATSPWLALWQSWSKLYEKLVPVVLSFLIEKLLPVVSSFLIEKLLPVVSIDFRPYNKLINLDRSVFTVKHHTLALQYSNASFWYFTVKTSLSFNK